METGGEDDEKLKEFKIVLRALLISQGSEAINVFKFPSLYKAETGIYFRFEDYGHSSLISLLKSLPDTCFLRQNRHGELCVYPVSNEKTAHVSALIAKQRKKRVRPSSAYRGRSQYRSHQNHSYQQYYSQKNLTGMHSSIPISSNLVLKVVTDMRSASSFSKSRGLRKFDILTQIKNRIGARGSNYHINNLNFHLSDLSDVIVVKDDSVFLKSDIDAPPLIRQPMNLVPQELRSQMFATSVKPVVKPLESPSPKLFITPGNNKTAFPPFNMSRHLAHNSTMTTPEAVDKLKNLQTTGLRNGSIDPIINGSSASITKTLIMDDHNMKQVNDIGLFSEDSQNMRKSLTKEVRTENNKTDIANQIISKDKKLHAVNDMIKERTKIRLEKLMEKHPDGMWCQELPSEYKKEYGIDLEYSDYGFFSITEFVAALPEIFFMTSPGDLKKHMIISTKRHHDKDKHVPKQTLASLYHFDDPEEEVEPIPLKLSQEVTMALIPDGFMNINDTVDQIRVSSIVAHLEDYFEVSVTEIFTPSFFWIRLRKNQKKFNSLMERLGDFYNSRKDLKALKVPQCVLQPGLNVACIYSHLWHRAVVKKVKHDGFIVVFFYDYGTVKSYNPNDLFFLHKSFSNFPAQAIACGLHHLKPIESVEWPKSSTNAFVDKVWNIPLIASIGILCEDSNTMMISLTDTSDDSLDEHINDWLVEKRHAMWGKMAGGKKIPLHKLCYYDEVELMKKRDEEYSYQQTTSLPQTASVPLKINENFTVNDCTPKDFDVNQVNSLSQTTDVSIAVEKNVILMKETFKKLESICIDTIDTDKCDQSFSVKSDSILDSLEDNENNNDYTDSKSARHSVTETISNDHLVNKDVLAHQDIDYKLTSSSYTFTPTIQQTNFNKSEQSCQRDEHNKVVQIEPRLNELTDLQSTIHPIGSSGMTNNSASINTNILRQQDASNTEARIDCNQDVLEFKSCESNRSSDIRVRKEDCLIQQRSSTQSICNSDMNSDSSRGIPTYFRMTLSEKLQYKSLHIFHYNGRGWLYVTEFVEIFTNLKFPNIFFKLLKYGDYSLTVIHLTRDMEPQLFSQLDKSEFDVPRENNIIKSDFELILIPLKNLLPVLREIDLVSLDDDAMDEAVIEIQYLREKAANLFHTKYNNKILYDVLNTILQYKNFKKSLKV